MKTIKYILLLLPFIGMGQILNDSIVYRGPGDALWQFFNDDRLKGWCESKTVFGQFKDYEDQLILVFECDEHKWAYDKAVSHYPSAVYACMNCCSTPNYPITQKRVCEVCGLIQQKTDMVEHYWVTPPPPPKTRYEQIIDSLKKKQ